MFVINESGIYKSLNLTVISEVQIEILSVVIYCDWRWDVRMVPGSIIWFRFSVGLIFRWRKWNFFRLCYSMADVCTVKWMTCEEAPTRNPWYCSAITSAKIAHLSWAVTGMMQRGAARSHVASVSGWRRGETLQSILSTMSIDFLNWSTFWQMHLAAKMYWAR